MASASIDLTSVAPALGRSTPPLVYEEDSPMPKLVITYAIVLLLLFFATGGVLPAAPDRSSSLAGTSNETDSLIGQLYQLAIWSFALFLMRHEWKKVWRLALRMRAMLALSLLAPASALWSQNPALSLRRGVFLILGLLFASYLVSHFSARQLAQIVIITGIFAAVISIAVAIWIPAVGLDSSNGNAWEGIFHAKNGLGQAAIFFLTPAVAFRFQSRLLNAMRIALFALATVLIIMSNAKTAWLLAPGYVVLIGFMSWTRRLKRKDALVMLLGGIGGLALLAAVFPYLLPPLLQSLGKDPGISGRVPLWASTLLSIAKRPLLGYGYQAFWTGLRGESLNVFMGTHFEIYQAQNGLLEIALELGLAGVVLVLLTLLGAVRDALVCIRHRQSDVVNWYVGILALTVAYNVDEAFLAVLHTLPWLLYVMACAGLSIEAHKIRARERRVRARTSPMTVDTPHGGELPKIMNAYREINA